MSLYACRRSLSVSCLSCRIDGGVSAREIVAVSNPKGEVRAQLVALLPKQTKRSNTRGDSIRNKVSLARALRE